MKKILIFLTIILLFSCENDDLNCFECLTNIEIYSPPIAMTSDTIYHKFITKSEIICGMSDIFVLDYELKHTHVTTILNQGTPISVMVPGGESLIITLNYTNAAYIEIRTVTRCDKKVSQSSKL